MTNKEILSAALKSDYLSELSVFEALPDYRMSRSFDRKMHKLIRAYLKRKNREISVITSYSSAVPEFVCWQLH